ncbi:MAG: LuxR C-terminal-related transcriptional regulator [Myxococcota bacterium]
MPTHVPPPAFEDLGDQLPPSEALDLAELWTGLVRGTHFIQESYHSRDRCFLTIELRSEARRRKRRLRMEVLERLLLGDSYKQVAYEEGLAVSTIALTCSQCLRAIGKVHLPSRVPPLVLMAVQAARRMPLPPARMYRFQSDGKEYWMVTAERPDRVLPKHLTPAEAEVSRLLVEGNTHQQIAILRSASKRTVANQLASSFRKLGVCGRTELVAMLIRKNLGVTLSPRREAHLF